MCLIQIGAGSANFDIYIKDGFSNFIKKKNIQKKIFIIEANSIHLESLKKFYKENKNVKIFNLAIVPDNMNIKKMNFFYCLEDSPNYQIFSNSKNFVKKHFPHGTIKEIEINCLGISEFLKKNDITHIDYLSLDIEGMDYEVLLNLNLDNFDIKNISFEHLHLDIKQKIKLILKFIKNGYYFSGMGFDLRKSDWMFSKNYKINRFLTYFLPITPRRVWKKYKFFDQI